MRPVACLLFGIHLAFAETHSLEHFLTVVYGVTNISEFTVVGMVDGQQFMYFDSNTNKAVPKTAWMREYEGAEYWDRYTQILINYYNENKIILQTVMDLYNQSASEDVQTFQMMYGCELEDDGTRRGYLQYGYNGDDFISFNKDTVTWTAGEKYHQAMHIRNQWDSDGAKTMYCKKYLESLCFEHMKKILNHGKDNLEKKDSPEVSLLQKDSSSPVICHATGFYPKSITMTWKKNNEDHYEDVEVSETLPNEDGSFQKTISLSVKSEELKKNPDVYRCVIQHVALEKDIVVLLNENNIRSNSDSDNILVKCLVFAAVSVIVGCLLALTVFAYKNLILRKSTQVKKPNSTGCLKGSNTDIEMGTKPQQNAK